MKGLVIVTLLLLADVSLSSPVRDGTSKLAQDPEHRWTLIPDSEGKMHLVDFDSYDVQVEPSFVPAQDIFFLLFTRSNPNVGQRIDFTTASLINSNFNPSHPTRFSVHGWQSESGTFTNTVVREAFYEIGEFNVIVVDWSVGAGSINYISSRNNVGPAGTHVATYIDFLHLHGYIRFEDLQLIGISLGGQLIGMAGKAVTRGRIHVIMSLDPAGPLFSLDRPDERVAPTDGVYVEVIHTNGGLLGFREPIGQADFFPNFGRSQPGCITDLTGTCSHVRSVTLHAESISTVFTGHECASFAEIDNEQCTRTGRTGRMGGPFGSVGLTGNYYLTTNDASPFSMG